MNDTAVSRRHSNSSKDDEGPNMRSEGEAQNSLTTRNRRKGKPIAKTEDSGRNPVQPTKSAMVDKAEREESILPSRKSVRS